MKTFLSFFVATCSFVSVFAGEITATVVFENFSNKTAISGVFYISETNERFQIHSLEKFSITLPNKGKYHFEFYSEAVNAFVSYPVRITEKKHTITIRLENKTADSVTSIIRNNALKDISNLSIDQIGEEVKNGTINFIHHGLLTLSPEAINAFKLVYGVGFISENCVIDPISFKTAMTTNKKIENYLNLTFGEAWKNKLPAKPFGL